MNVEQFKQLFKDQKFYYYKFNSDDKSICCNSNGGSSQPLRELIDITKLLEEHNIKYILRDQNKILVEL